MATTVAEIRKTVPITVKIVTIDLSPIGYDGAWVKMRTNPKASVYDDFLSNDQEGETREWDAWKVIVIDWNLGNEDGTPLPLPKDGLARKDLPYDIQAYIVREYIEAFGAGLRVPKELQNNSENTSSTNGAIQTLGKA